MNNTIKKVCAVILTLIIVSITYSVYAVEVTVGSLAISSPATVNQGEEFTVTINLSNFNTSASMVAIIGKIEYEKDKIEYISNSISSNTTEGWDDIQALGEQSFRESNMAFILENKTPLRIGANSNLLTLKFKAKVDIEGTTTIKVNVNSVTDATNFSGASTTVTIAKPAEQQPGGQQGEQGGQQGEQPGSQQGGQQGGQQGQQSGSQQQGQQSQSKPQTGSDDKTKVPGKLPKTGENDLVWIGIGVCAIVAIANIIYMKKAKRD